MSIPPTSACLRCGWVNFLSSRHPDDCPGEFASNVVKLRPKAPRKTLERDIVNEIRSAIGRLPWATVWRNNTGVLKDARGIPVTYGLCVGSADLIGFVECTIPVWAGANVPAVNRSLRRFVALEVKRPGKEPTEDQERFLAVVRGANGSGAAACVTSCADALQFLEKVRRLEV